MIKEYSILKIRYSETEINKFKILLMDEFEEDVILSDDLTSLDAARIHHILANIEESLRYEIKWTTEQLSGTAPLLTIDESQFTLYINRLELHDRYDEGLDINEDIFYYPLNSFDEIDKLKNFFAEAQY